MATEDDSDVPETGAVFTFGKSKFGDNSPSKFWIRNDKVIHTSCGDEHTALVAESGRAFMFGSNSWGQLGLAHATDVNKPSRVKALKGEKVTLVACGRSHTIFATDSGKLFACGSNGEGQLGIGSSVDKEEKPTQLREAVQEEYTMLAAGADHTVALTASGDVYVWGGGSEGQLGLGEDDTEVTVPTLLVLSEPAVCIACGYYHTAVVTESGKLLMFGEDEDGKLGLGMDTSDHMQPRQVTSIRGKVSWVACGGSHTVAVTSDGRVYTFGNGSNGQLGHGNTMLAANTPEEITWPSKTCVKLAACGENHTALITDRGYMYTCGDGRHGKLAQGEENFANQFRPTHVARFTNFYVEKIACGGCHMLALSRPRVDSDDTLVNGDEHSDEEDVSEQNVINRISPKYPIPDLTTSLDLSGSISARNRRREKLPDPSGTLNRTLPALNSSISNKSSLPPLNGHLNPLDRGLLPTIDKIQDASELSKAEKSEESEGSEDMAQERNYIKRNSASLLNSAPSPKPRATPRKATSSNEDSGNEDIPSDGDEMRVSDTNEGKSSREDETMPSVTNGDSACDEEADDDGKQDSHHSDKDADEESETQVNRPVPSARRMAEIQNKAAEERLEDEDAGSEEDEDRSMKSKNTVKKKARQKVDTPDDSEEEENSKKKKERKKMKEKPAKKKKASKGLFGRKKVMESEDEEDDKDDSQEEKDKVTKKKKKTAKKPAAESEEDEQDEEDQKEKERVKVTKKKGKKIHFKDDVEAREKKAVKKTEKKTQEEESDHDETDDEKEAHQPDKKEKKKDDKDAEKKEKKDDKDAEKKEKKEEEKEKKPEEKKKSRLCTVL